METSEETGRDRKGDSALPQSPQGRVFIERNDVPKGLSAKEAIDKVRKSRPHAVETKELEESLEKLQKALRPNPGSP